MAMATFAIPSFHGGQISEFAQGRFDKPDYRISLNVCLNSFAVEIGTWTRRPGTQYAGHTRGGNKGRVLEFDFEQSSPSTMEFTDGWLRFRNGPLLLTAPQSAQTILSISSANPAVVQTAAPHGNSTGNTNIFSIPSVALLENRQFTVTVIDTTHFSLQDALTGANIDGSTLGALAAGATVSRVQELQTVFGAGSWAVSSMRTVQAETTNILLNGSIAPQAVTVSSLPTQTANAVFAIGPVTFNDGPYLDPFTNGVRVTPNALSGIVTMTLSFPAYNSTIAYPNGSLVSASGTNYVSILDQNVGNTPSTSPTFWQATSIGAGINNGAGLSATDIGRLARFFNEPSLWATGSTYSQGNLVTYNPSGIPGEETYWSSLTNTNSGNIPGTDATNWSPVAINGAAIWTWGKITSLSNAISGSTGSNIGNLTGGGGLAAAFDGNPNKSLTGSAENSQAGGAEPYFTILTLDSYVGKNYTSESGEQIDHVVVYPTLDQGLGGGSYTWEYTFISPQGPFTSPMGTGFTLNLRASATLPASPGSGTLLGTVSVTGNTFDPITINSSDKATAYNYAWVELIGEFQNPNPGGSNVSTQLSYFIFEGVAQVAFFNPVGASAGASFNVEILGPSLLRETLITTWRMGAYGGPNGYPTCGCYAEGRAWLGGAIANRFDASVSNGINGASINMAPTDQYGVVAESAAISETLNSDSVNPIRAMKADAQGVVMFTQNGEWLISAPTTGPMAPDNITARRVTKHGCDNIEPIRTPHANIFVKRYARKLLEYFADAFSGKYSAPNLADKAENICTNGIAELAFTEATTPIIWGYDTLGSMFGVTYKRDALMTSNPPDFYGWHQHSLGSGRIVESMCSGASVDGDLDTLTMVTNDPATNIRHVELLTDIMNETTSLSESWFLDDAVMPTSTSSTITASPGFPYGGLTINGLWHLNGKTVQVFAGGLDLGNYGTAVYPAFNAATTYAIGAIVSVAGVNYKSLSGSNTGNAPASSPTFWLAGTPYLDFVVSNGSVTVPYGDSISWGPGQGLFTPAFFAKSPQIVVGFTYNSDGQMVRPIAPADTGARNGPALGKIRRIHRIAALLSNTLGISFGTSFSALTPARFLLANRTTPIPNFTTYSGVFEIPIPDQPGYDGMMCWRVSRPFPANVVAISGNIDTADQ
jgi:hypothetical protein